MNDPVPLKDISACVLDAYGTLFDDHSAVSNAGIAVQLDAVLSIEAVGSPKIYQLAVDRLGVAPEAICFMSSNAWDAAGAAYFGFQVAWVNRFGQPKERLPCEPKAEITSLEPLPELVCG